MADASEMNLFFEHMEQTLITLGFYNPQNPRQLMTRLRRLFARTRLDELELNIMRGIFSAIDKELEKVNKHLR